MAYTKLGSYQVNGKNIYGKTLSNYFFGVDVYTESSNATNNYTNVKFIPWVMMDGGSTTTSSTFYFKCDGATYQSLYIKLGVDDTAGYAVPYHANEKIIKYYHNDDGTKNITFNFSVETEVKEGANANLNNYCFKSASITQTITLPKINRISPFSWSGDWVMGQQKTITISPYVSGYSHALTFTFGSITGTIAAKTTSKTINWTPSKELGGQIPGASSGVGTITCTTYNGDVALGSTSKTFTLYLAGDMLPTFDYTMTGNDLFDGLFISNKSTVTFKITNAVGSYGSTIKSYSISGEKLTSSSSEATSSRFDRHGTFTYTLKVTDSRNRVATITKSVVVYEYFQPQVLLTSIVRCDQNGNPSEIGNNVLLKANIKVANPNNNGLNEKDLTLQYRVEGETSWITIKTESLSSYNLTNYVITNNQTVDGSRSYEFRVGVTDRFSTQYSTGLIPTSTCIIDIEPNGLGVGKYHQNGALDIGGDIYVDGIKFYENGTFDAAFFGGEGTNCTITRKHCNYQKVGKFCTCNISLVGENFTFPSSNNQQFKIINLPFVNKGAYAAVTIGFCAGVTLSEGGTLRAYVRPNESDIIFVIQKDNGESSTLYQTSMYTTRIDIQISLTYQVEL